MAAVSGSGLSRSAIAASSGEKIFRKMASSTPLSVAGKPWGSPSSTFASL